MPIEPLREPIDERGAVEDAIRRGSVVFLGMDLLVARGALVPRRETELLATTAIALVAASGVGSPRVIDMCCGAGNLACAIAHHAATAQVWASDLTDACVDLARTNAERVGVSDRVTGRQGDLFEALADCGLQGTADVVVCNPPYISEKRLESDRTELLELEPQEAFAAGPYGISIHQRVIRDALRFLRPGGALCVEIGAGQGRQVEALFKRSKGYDEVRAASDANGEPRVIIGRRRAIEAANPGESS